MELTVFCNGFIQRRKCRHTKKLRQLTLKGTHESASVRFFLNSYILFVPRLAGPD